jgi:peptidoglycan/LPS O-acetylase OafA/YrhL
MAFTVAFGIAIQAAALVLVFGYGWSQEFWLDLMASRNIVWRIPEFVTGVVVARLLYGGHLPWLQGAGARNALLLASLALVLVLNAAPWPDDLRSVLIMRQFRLEVAYMMPFAGIILALAAGPTVASPALKRPSWVFLGDISYGIYIFHWIPWTVLAHAKAGGWTLGPALVTATILLTILFSAASYLWFEKPARLRIRQKFGQ